MAIAWKKQNRAAFSNSEHSDLIFLTFFLKTQLSISPNSTCQYLFKNGVDIPVGALEPYTVKTLEIPQRRATSKIFSRCLFVSKPCITHMPIASAASGGIVHIYVCMYVWQYSSMNYFHIDVYTHIYLYTHTYILYTYTHICILYIIRENVLNLASYNLTELLLMIVIYV